MWVPNKKIITRLLINNWGGITRQVMEFNQYVNLFSGMSGSGKSTVMDAIQVLLYGSLSQNFLNKAADERNRRTVMTYLKGAQKDGTSNRGAQDFCSTLVMEIKDTADGSFRCIGAAFDVRAGETEISRYAFFSHEGMLDASGYCDSQGTALRVREIGNLVRRHQKDPSGRQRSQDINRVYPTNDAYQTALYGPIFGYIDGRRFATMEKSAVALKMSNGVGQFIRDYMFPKSDSQVIEKISRQLGEYTQIRDAISDLENRLKLLGTIREKNQGLAAARAKVAENEYILKELRILGIQEEISRLETEQSAGRLAVASLEEKAGEQKRELSRLQEELVELRSLQKAGDYGKRQEQLEQLGETVALLEKNQTAWEHVKESLRQWERNGQVWELVGNRAVQAMEDLQAGNVSPEILDHLRLGLQETLDEAGQQRDGLVVRRRELASARKEKEERLEDLEKGQKSYRSRRGLKEAQRELERALYRETGTKIPVLILADGFDIRDARWKDAIEGRMGRSKYSLVTAPEYSDLAARLFGPMREYENIDLLHVRNLMEDEPQVLDHSLYQAVETDLDYVDACLKHFLGRVIQCENVKELTGVRDGVTPDGYSYSGYVLRHLRKKDYEDNACIGRTVSRKAAEKLRQEAELLRQEEKTVDGEIHGLEQASGYERLAQNNPYYMDLFSSGRELKAARERQNRLEEEIRRLDQGEARKLNQQLEQTQARYRELEDAYGASIQEKGKTQAALAVTENQLRGARIQLQEALQGFRSKEEENQRLRELLQTRSLNSLRTQAARDLEGARQEEQLFYSQRLEARFQFNRLYSSCNLTGTEESNQAYDQLYDRYDRQYVEEYKEEFDRKCQEIYRSLRDNVIAAIHGDIKAAYRQVREINKVLGATAFSDSVYKIGITPASNENRQFYDMLMAEELDSKVISQEEDMEGQLSLGEDLFLQKYEKEIQLLVEKFIPEQTDDEKEAARRREQMERYADYRNYLTFNMYEVSTDSQGREKRIPVDEMAGNDSGGEGQNPKYVALFAGFALLFAQASHRESRIRIVLLDEAFSKMDKTRSSVCLNYARKLGLQVIICVPDERLMTLVKNVDCVYGFCRKKNRISMLMIDKGAYLEMLEGRDEEEPDFRSEQERKESGGNV